MLALPTRHLTRTGRLALVAIVTVAAGVLSAGCSSASTPAPTPAPTITVSGAWIRAAATAATPTAAYLVIANPGSQADALLSASSPAATMVEVHETTTDMSGMTGMHPISRLEVPAGGSVELKQGGYHLMFTGLKAPLAAGATVEIDLVFEHAGKVVVQAAVRAS